MRQYMFNQRTCLLWLQKGVLLGLGAALRPATQDVR